MKYRDMKPVLYYGSSITQGGCCSRPGNTYQAVVSRRLNIDFVNLGFSGNARGERAMAEYVAAQPMSAFAFDYDHNAPSVEHLKNTHYDFYCIKRTTPLTQIVLLPGETDGVQWASMEQVRKMVKSREICKIIGNQFNRQEALILQRQNAQD